MKIALVGNQNSGKTTLFNLLTGSNQKIGNWPGVTIERKEGKIKGTDFTLVDLPGIYSLSPYTSEEKISRNYILEEKPDLIINIVDATSIERSLYLTTQLLELDCKVIIALNMCDILEKKGLVVHEDILSKKLQTTVIKISALKNIGIDHLIQHIKDNEIEDSVDIKIFSDKIEKEIELIETKLNCNNKRFIAIKTLENDIKQEELDCKESISKLEKDFDMDIEEIFANGRYEFIEKVKKESVINVKTNKETISDKLDKVFLNKYAAIPIFVLIMGLVYLLAVGVVGTATVDFMDTLIADKLYNLVANWLTNLNASPWAISLVCDGIIAGVGAVLNFVPQLMILFFLLAILETTGYMARITLFLDKLFRKLGLSGKSLIPFIVGSGCSVPGIMSSRTIENEKERELTILLTPFIPCSAKLPIITLFASAFFENYAWLATISLYLFAIAIIVLSAYIINKFFIKQKFNTFILELPEYKLPSIKYVLKDVFDKTISFIKRAGSIILLCSVVVWFLASFTITMKYIDGETLTIESSMLAGIGNLFSWVFYPMLGELSWGAAVSAIQGLVAKEQVVSSMEVIAGLAEGSGVSLFNTNIFSFFNSASAYAFMVFNLFSAPCFGAIGAMKREFGSSKKMWIAILFQTGTAWVLASLVFLIGTLIGVIF
ncbi:MAG: ferrous iron transport protein B [Bacilli bacterium]|nr:ferrous iron transport protein B [Bacilli bacterium]